MSDSVTTPEPEINDISALVGKISDRFSKEKQEIDASRKGMELWASRLKKEKRTLEEKSKQLSEWEIVLNQKYEEVSRLQNAIKLDYQDKQRIKESSARVEN